MMKKMVSNEKLRDNESQTAETSTKKRSDVKTKVEALLTFINARLLLRSLGDAEQRLADVRLNSTADKSRKSGQKEREDQKSDHYQEPRSVPKSLPIGGLCSHSQRPRTKSNRTSVCSKSSTTKQVMLLEQEGLKKQEEIDEQLAAKKRHAVIRKKHEDLDKLTE